MMPSPKNVYIGNLTYEFSSSDLQRLCSPFGTVLAAEVITDTATGRSKGFGRVLMSNEAEAWAVAEKLFDQECDGRRLTTHVCNPPEDRLRRPVDWVDPFKVFVAGLPDDSSDPDLRRLCSPFGTVVSAEVVKDRETGRSQGFGLVEMGSEAEARAVIEGLAGHESDGSRLDARPIRPGEDSRGPARWPRPGYPPASWYPGDRDE